MKYLILILLTSLTASATLNDVDKQMIVTKNLLVNGGFENGKQTWTASGGTFAIASSGSNLLTGLASATWDSNGAAQTLRTALIAVPNGLKNRPAVAQCKILVPSGTATHTLSVSDGSLTLSTGTVISNTSPAITAVTFLAPSSGSIRLVLTSVNADEPSITVDECYMGDAQGVALINAKTQDVFSAQVSSGDVVSSENVDWINGDCTNASTGRATCNFNSGIFSVAPNCVTTASLDTNIANSCHIISVSSSSLVIECAGSAEADRAFSLTCQKASIDSPSVAFKPDTLANSWSGYHDSTCSGWTRTNTALGDVAADASCGFTELTNNNFGTVTSYVSGSDKLPGFIFTPKSAGRYYVCASLVQSGGTTGAYQTTQMLIGSTEVDTIVGRVANGSDLPIQLCGLAVATDTTAQTIKIFTAASSGANNISSAASGATGARSIVWKIFKVDQSTPMAVMANSVVSKYAGVSGIEVANLNCDSGSAVTQEFGDWVSTIGNISGGACTITLQAGVFSSAPRCVATDSNSGHNPDILAISSASSTSLTVNCTGNTGASCTTTDFNLFCFGPR